MALHGALWAFQDAKPNIAVRSDNRISSMQETIEGKREKKKAQEKLDFRSVPGVS